MPKAAANERRPTRRDGGHSFSVTAAAADDKRGYRERASERVARASMQAAVAAAARAKSAAGHSKSAMTSARAACTRRQQPAAAACSKSECERAQPSAHVAWWQILRPHARARALARSHIGDSLVSRNFTRRRALVRPLVAVACTRPVARPPARRLINSRDARARDWLWPMNIFCFVFCIVRARLYGGDHLSGARARAARATRRRVATSHRRCHSLAARRQPSTRRDETSRNSSSSSELIAFTIFDERASERVRVDSWRLIKNTPPRSLAHRRR